MVNINGQEITKTVNGWVVDGAQAYLGRDGLTLVTGSGKPLAVLSATQLTEFRAEEDALRAARLAPKAAATRVERERSFDRAHNEGGEGFNPHRFGAAKTYRR